MRSKLLSSFGVVLVTMIACGGSGDDNNTTDGGKAGKGGKAGDSGVGGSGTGANGSGATGTGATGTGATGTGATGTGATGSGGVAGGSAGTGATGTGGSGGCVPATCQGHLYQCGNCTDDDGDGLIDAADPDCWGVCQNNESGFVGDIPGQANPPCKQDCYFDQDSGSGNDDCAWDHQCDPNEVAPNFPPENGCNYNANTKVVQSGGPKTCDQALNTQTQACLNYCGPLVPNGCDCFGCCNIPGAPTPVWLGSVDASGAGTCTLNDVADPLKCKPCEIVLGCFNDCLHCELCIGKPTLPSDCTNTGGTGGTGGSGGTGGVPTGGGGVPSGGGGSGGTGGGCIVPLCPAGVQPCGVSCAPACAAGTYCVTGCCQKVPA